jgi:hypothetical protein
MRAKRQLTDLAHIDDEKAARLSDAGFGSVEALAKASPKQIVEASGLEGMQAIIAREQAARTVEARREKSIGGKVGKAVSQTSPKLQRKARMWLSSRIGRLLSGR